MRMRLWHVALLMALVSLVAACEKKTEVGAGTGTGSDTPRSTGEAGGSARCPHDIKQEKCPFCVPALVESEGFCGEHGVAEALCVACRPYLKAAFRAKGDWCKEHDVPESQCVQCNPELKEKTRPGEHGSTAPAPESEGPK